MTSSPSVTPRRSWSSLLCTGLAVVLLGTGGCGVDRIVVIQSTPSEATVLLDGADVGETPVTKKLKWKEDTRHSIAVSLRDHGSASKTLSHQDAKGAPPPPKEWTHQFNLVRLRAEIPVNLTCNVADAEVSVDSKVIGASPLKRTFVFTRRNIDAPWSTFVVTVSKDGHRARLSAGTSTPGHDAPFTTVLTYDLAKGGTINAELEPLRFVWTKLKYYKFDGERVGIAEELVLAQVGEVETEPMVQSVTRMTDLDPDKLIDTRLWVAPPEQQLVYSKPSDRTEVEGSLSNLWRQVGQAVIRLTDGPYVDVEACVSADGQFSYFSANRLRPDKFNLWRVRMTGQGGFTKITDSPSSYRDAEPVSSPDGRHIAYTSYLLGVKPPQIWVAQPDGTLPTQLRIGQSPSWSPNSQQLAYVAIDDDRFKQIWVMNADASRPTQLTSSKAQNEYPIWTPDGKRIVYASNEVINAEGVPNYDIWIMDIDGTNRTQLTVNGSWDNRPAISPDSKYIYFLSNRGAKKAYENNWQVWRIELK